MGIPKNFLRNIGRRAVTKVMDRVGGRIVSGMADTSADAPASRFEPKRNLYEEIKRAEDAAAASDEDPAAASDHDSAHDHDHDHDH